MWPTEEIPDSDKLYYRVHKALVPDGRLRPAIFRQQGESLSTDWERYSTPEASRLRARDPSKNGIITMIAGFVRSLDMAVEHSPDEENGNRAHTDVLRLEGPRSTELRL